ncbi:MAG: hypothetical protein QGH40_08245, partial [bacterium]|nr:hypothetical protein [bacterium]
MNRYLRPIWAVARKELMIFISYPTWIIMITLFPIIFTCNFLFIGKLFSGTMASGSQNFTALAGT